MRQCLILTECKHFNCSSFNNKKKNELTDTVYELSPAITVWVHAVREKKRKSLKSTSRDRAIFVRQIFSPFSESPWETNDVFSFTPPPNSWTWQSGIRHWASKADESVKWPASWKQKGSRNESGKSKEWYVSFSDVIHPNVQGDSGGGNGLSQRMTSSAQAVRQVVKGPDSTLPLFPGLMLLFRPPPALTFVNLTLTHR